MQSPKMERTWDLFNWLISEFGYERYLEIGCRDDTTFSRVMCPYKVGVDPHKGGTVRATSDKYFETCEDNFDLVFVDGLHEHGQVLRDFENSLKRLRPGGTIVLHDCDPPTEERQRVPQGSIRGWCGDVWKAYVQLRSRHDVDCAMTMFDMGMGIVRIRSNRSPITLSKPCAELTWDDLVANKDTWQRQMDELTIKSWTKSG